MTHLEARNQEWVKEKATGKIGLLLRQANGWDVAYASETKQSVDLGDYDLADPKQHDGPPPVVEKRAGDTSGGLGESVRRKR